MNNYQVTVNDYIFHYGEKNGEVFINVIPTCKSTEEYELGNYIKALIEFKKRIGDFQSALSVKRRTIPLDQVIEGISNTIKRPLTDKQIHAINLILTHWEYNERG